MGRLYLKIFSILLLSATLAGCESLFTLFKDDAKKSDNSGFESSNIASWSDGKARVKPGVLLQVQVSYAGSKPVEMAAQVDPQGRIILPYMLREPVHCDGLTLEEVQFKIHKAYQRYIRQPQVTVHFGPYDPRTGVSPYGFVTVLGEIVNPGPVNMPPTMDLTVTKALQMAGNTKPFANKRNVLVTRRAKDGSLIRTEVDIIEIGEKGRIDKDIILKPGDVVYVRESVL
jgi:protein involved in polysaccharide export with SLBB domain